METELKNILSNISKVSIDNIFSFFEKSGDIFIIKYDGIRLENKYTLMIMSKVGSFEMIRYDGNDLRKCLSVVLSGYLQHLS